MSFTARALSNYRVLRLLLVIVVLACVAIRSYFERRVDIYNYILVLLSIPLVLSRPLLVFTLSLAFSIVIASLNYTVLLVFSTIIAILGFLVLYVESLSNILSKVITSLLVFTPIYIVVPLSLIPVLVVAALLVLISIREYLRLSKSSVDVFLESGIAYLGDLVKYRVVIMCPDFFKYSVLEGNKSVTSGLATNRVVLDLSFRGEYLGVIERSVRVIVEDVRGFARIVHGPYTLSFKVLARVSGLVKRAEKLVEKYAVYLSTPRVVKVVLGRGVEGFAGVSRVVGGVGVSGWSGLSGEVLREHGVSELATTQILPPGVDLTSRVISGVEKPFTERSVGFKWVIMKTLMREIQATISLYTSRAYFGEYMGTREYQPGDSPRIIHWKKSLRRELLEDLYVKVYAKELTSSGGGGGVRIILVDLTATSPFELDMLLSALYGELLSELTRERPLTQVHLFIKIPREELIHVSGKLVDVTVALNTIIQKYDVKALFNYETWRRTRSIRLGESLGFISNLENYYRAYGSALAELFKTITSERATVQLIHSNALGYKYSIITQTLKDAGFMVLRT